MAYQRFWTPKALLLFPLLLLVLAVACGASATPVPAAQPTAAAPAPGAGNTPTAMPKATAVPAGPTVNPGRLTWMTAGWGAERFDSVLAGTGGSNQFIRLMHAYPIASNEKGEMIPGLATDWKLSPDGLTWIVNFRDTAKFHDGSPVTAADVAWTFNHNFSKEAKPYSKSTTGQAQSAITNKIEQTGPNQVSVTLSEIYTGFPVGLMAEAGPNTNGAILPKRATLHDEALEAAYDQKPIGAGQLKVIRRVQAERMDMERFDDYYYQTKNGLPEDRRVRFQLLTLRLVPEESTRVAAIRAGEADIAPASLATRSQVEAGGGRMIFGPEGVYVRVRLDGCWHDATFPCADKRVRQALDYAINKEIIRDKLYGGPSVFQAKGWAHVTPSSLGYSPELDPFPFNPTKARELLAAAGYKTPSNPGGKDFGKLLVHTWVSASIPFLPEGAQLAADSWRRELGIDTEVKIGEEAAINAMRRDGALAGQITWRDNEARMDGSSITLSSYGTPSLKDRLTNDPEIFAMAKAALSVTDLKEQPMALNKVYRRLREETHELGVGYVNIPWALGPRVVDWKPFAFSFFPSGIHTITLK